MTLQQKLFRQFVLSHYEELSILFPLRDSMHSAFLEVFLQQEPIIPPVPKRFLQELSRNYHRFVLADMQYRFRYLLPDPAYWLYQTDDIQDDIIELLTDDTEPDIDIDIDIDMNSISRYILRHCSPIDYSVFYLTCISKYKTNRIASITGLRPAAVKKSLNRIIRVLEKSKFNTKNKKL